MTNRTIVFSELNADLPTAATLVSKEVNDFVAGGIGSGYTAFHIKHVVVTPQYLVYVPPPPIIIVPPVVPGDIGDVSAPPVVIEDLVPYSAPSGSYWCTVEVDYYDPAIM